MTGEELRRRIARLGLSYRKAAPLLGLSLSGLHHNLRDERPIGRPTEIILGYLEKEAHASHNLRKPSTRATRALRSWGSGRPTT
jgi:hypothetical protein